MTVKFKFGSALFAARSAHRLTQAKAAEKLGISVRWYQRVEKGESEPNLRLVCQIAKEFHLDFAECLTGEEELQ